MPHATGALNDCERVAAGAARGRIRSTFVAFSADLGKEEVCVHVAPERISLPNKAVSGSKQMQLQFSFNFIYFGVKQEVLVSYQ